jgi:putative heme-binding domain-containing protein
MVYLDELLFGGEVQHAFTCEPFSNLVQHNLLIEDGATFKLERAPAETEAATDFFASQDRWCRPVMVRTGPDGALWVVDMYRYMIEHPQWLPKEGQDELRPFFRAGDDRGRIYRVVPQSGAGIVRAPAFLKASGLAAATVSAEQLIRQLQSPNGWLRDAAQRLLVERRPEGATEQLRELLRSDTRATARLHALCTLAELQELQLADIEVGLADPHGGVRRWAVRLALSSGASPNQLNQLIQLADDKSLKVRLELATLAGNLPGPQSAAILSELLGNTDDAWVQAAVLSSLNSGNAVAVAESVAQRGRGQQMEQLGQQATALGTDEQVANLLLSAAGEVGVAGAYRQRELLVGMLQRLLRDEQKLQRLLGRNELQVALVKAFDRAAKEATADQPAAGRALAVRLLLLDPQLDRRLDVVEQLLSPRSEAALQTLAVQGLATRGFVGTGELLLSRWNSLTPAVRREAFQAIAGRREWIAQLVQQLESGSISAGEVDAAQRQRLLAAANASSKERLEKLFAGGTDRRAVLEASRPVLELQGDGKRGAAIFQKRCSSCHRQNGVGHEVGPNLASLTSREPGLLLNAILDPSAAVEAKYLNFVAVTTAGRSVAGMLTTETATGLTFLAAEGKTETLLRAEIEELRSTGKSLMPEGLEKELSQQDLADVIEFVRGLGKAE